MTERNQSDWYDLQARSLAALADDPLMQEEEPTGMRTLDTFREEPVQWLIPQYLPKEQITLICGTGGTGKTSIWVSLVASLSSGKRTLFDGSNEYAPDREPQTVMFFSAEDTVENVIKGKLTKQNCIETNIMTISLSDPEFDQIQFGSEKLRQLIELYRPALCVFDPLQAFIDPHIKMSDRNAMRQNMRSLIEWGKEYGTTFLIVMHTNKQQNVWGRQRMADSADLWDIARCVWMVGDTQEDGIKYLSHEKSNYGRTGKTMLFKNEGGQPTFWQWSDLKDRDYVLQAAQKRDEKKNGSDIDGAIETILCELSDHPEGITASDLDEILTMIGFSARSIKTAKKTLKDRQSIVYRKAGMNGGWIVKKT